MFTTRKNKINLTDYNYHRDIENRLFMAHLSILEVDVLLEIINGSLKTSVATLADNLNISVKNLKMILDKLIKSRLFKIQNDWIIVDKEMRKYYESQIIKFDDDFRPDLEYLQGLLSKVPIHSLPMWYAIPKNSDNIFNSIIEKFLLTPKIYDSYLQELNFEQPILTSIVKEVFSAPDYKISSRKLIEKFKLSREKFEEYMLFLEFSLVACISYSKSKDVWEEVVTPFHEWRELLLFVQNSSPTIIKDVKKIKPIYNEEFGFLNELNAFVKDLLQKASPLKNRSSSVVDAAILLKIAQKEKKGIIATTHTKEWLEKNLFEQAISLYRQTLKKLLMDEQWLAFSEKDFREVEKSLRRLAHGNWVLFEDFIKSCLAPVGSAQPVHLQNKGRRWKYVTPKYQDHEIDFIQHIVCDFLMQVGMIDIGKYNEKLCFRLTPFGRQTLA